MFWLAYMVGVLIDTYLYWNSQVGVFGVGMDHLVFSKKGRICVCILWINLDQSSPFCVLCGKKVLVIVITHPSIVYHNVPKSIVLEMPDQVKALNFPVDIQLLLHNHCTDIWLYSSNRGH